MLVIAVIVAVFGLGWAASSWVTDNRATRWVHLPGGTPASFGGHPCRVIGEKQYDALLRDSIALAALKGDRQSSATA